MEEGGGKGKGKGKRGGVTVAAAHIAAAALAGVLGRRLAAAAVAGGFGRSGRVVGRALAAGCILAGCILAAAAGCTHAAAGHTLAGRSPDAQAGLVGSRRIGIAGSRSPTFLFFFEMVLEMGKGKGGNE